MKKVVTVMMLNTEGSFSNISEKVFLKVLTIGKPTLVSEFLLHMLKCSIYYQMEASCKLLKGLILQTANFSSVRITTVVNYAQQTQ